MLPPGQVFAIEKLLPFISLGVSCASQDENSNQPNPATHSHLEARHLTLFAVTYANSPCTEVPGFRIQTAIMRKLVVVQGASIISESDVHKNQDSYSCCLSRCAAVFACRRNQRGPRLERRFLPPDGSLQRSSFAGT